jgi:hypothetical protein
MNLFMSIKESMTRELVPVNEPSSRRYLRLGMFAMGGLLLGLGAWKIPALDLEPGGRMVGWMALAVTVTQCVVAGLLSGRYHLEKGFHINGQGAWMLVGTVVFVGSILGLSRVGGITPAQLQLGCLLAVMLSLNCFMIGLLWPMSENKSNADE